MKVSIKDLKIDGINCDDTDCILQELCSNPEQMVEYSDMAYELLKCKSLDNERKSHIFWKNHNKFIRGTLESLTKECMEAWLLFFNIVNSNNINNSKNIYNSTNVNESANIFNSDWIVKSDKLNNCYTCYNCIQCNNCLYCYCIAGKDYMAFNKPVTKERFEELKKIYNEDYTLLKKVPEYNSRLYRELESYQDIKGILIK